MSRFSRITCILILLLAISGCSLTASTSKQSIPDRPDSKYYTDASVSESPSATPTSVPTITPTPTPEPTPTPLVKQIVVSFAGDCTLGQNVGTQNNSNSYSSIIGTDYAYPFKNAVDILSRDDLSLVNLEGTLTSSDKARDKEFAFKGPEDFVKILTLGSIEAVNLANNHSYDYADKGLKDTKDTLDSAGISWSMDSTYAIREVNGVKIGMAGFLFPYDLQPIYDAIDSLRSQGCEIVIISVHTGVERMYEPEPQAVEMAHAIIDLGADIYVGHHPHRLQPIELYHGKYILYSLSNFTFGGQPNLTDPDTAIVQCTFSLSIATDKVIGNTLHVIPFSMTSSFPNNDYCPVPYEQGSDAYLRVFDKLNWSEDLETYAGFD